MKRLLLIIRLIISILLATQSAWAANPGKTVPKARITSILTDYRNCEGAEFVHFGRIATGALKIAVRLAATDDPDAREALRLMRGIHGITVFDFSDCSAVDKNRINRRLERALNCSEMLMETSDDGSKMTIYGVVDDEAGTVRDFVLYTPSDNALICIFGSISMDAIAKIASDD